MKNYVFSPSMNFWGAYEQIRNWIQPQAALIVSAESKSFQQTLWSLRTGRQMRYCSNRFLQRKQMLPSPDAWSGRGWGPAEGLWGTDMFPWWSQQNAVSGSRLAIQWACTVLTYTVHDSQTSDYCVNKYQEGPELNSIPLQQSHWSLCLIPCWIGRDSWNKTKVSCKMTEIKGIRESLSCPVRATVCPLGQQHLHTLSGQPIKPTPTMQDAQSLQPYIPANDSGDRATYTPLTWCRWVADKERCLSLTDLCSVHAEHWLRQASLEGLMIWLYFSSHPWAAQLEGKT